ncbi:uncharacterized protein BDZ99DRAFT_463774 [Mytilinidion resinicola]|uniref:Uncharacterized protein n=1 Tax=Mytilinidion resinicola TaxID=574789 RepID=A0A6A6YLQ8_9PEZI|nr:uncharacterized protein BDZ99DRAFT_463774 [Mytilinidion resinicola]KAF2808915.1 hypothetical protein BDZ99DRAFT_463774 [Mytilinidion resinicola]
MLIAERVLILLACVNALPAVWQLMRMLARRPRMRVLRSAHPKRGIQPTTTPSPLIPRDERREVLRAGARVADADAAAQTP